MKIHRKKFLIIIGVILLISIIIILCTYNKATKPENEVITSNIEENTQLEKTPKEIPKEIPEEIKTPQIEEKSNEEVNNNTSTTTNEIVQVVPQPKTYSYGRYTLQENSLDNTKVEWYFKRNTNFTRPAGAKTESFLSEYSSHYIGNNRNVIYLTFDEGNISTYSAQNMDTLKKHGIKATFFVTKPFMDNHPNLIKRMINEGHTVGNHSVTHSDMTSLANGDNTVNFIKEIADTENRFKEITGRDITKIFRYPEGSFSQKTLSLTQVMGYRSYFWSFAYKDWEENGNTKEQSLNWLKGYYHPGAIYLLHGISKGNAAALDDFITFMKSKGYSFDLVTNI